MPFITVTPLMPRFLLSLFHSKAEEERIRKDLYTKWLKGKEMQRNYERLLKVYRDEEQKRQGNEPRTAEQKERAYKE